MKFIIVSLSLCLYLHCFNFVGGVPAQNDAQKYTNKYDNIDVDRILASRRLVLAYVNCLLEKSPCSPEGRELKKYAPEALATDCVKCTETQRIQVGKVFSFLLQNYRKEWDALLAKYDPDGNYRKKYEVGEDYDYSQLDDA